MKKYNSPKMEAELLLSCDVLTVSNGGDADMLSNDELAGASVISLFN